VVQLSIAQFQKGRTMNCFLQYRSATEVLLSENGGENFQSYR